jgi:hypothetical protein
MPGSSQIGTLPPSSRSGSTATVPSTSVATTASKAAGVMKTARDFAAYSGFNFLVIVDRPWWRAGAYRGSSDGAVASVTSFWADYRVLSIW